jgi:RNA polymerase sigma-70 factor (ECF subfamily)
VTLGEQFASVLAAAQFGEEWALTQIYRAFQPRLVAYLSVQEPSDADDLASEIWMDAAARLSNFTGDEASFARWLFTIARRRVIDLRRSARRRRVLPAPVEAFVGTPAGGTPESDVLAFEAEESALRLISSLPPDQAEVVLLRVVVGLNVVEVAEVVGKRPGAVRALQHRALRRLAKEISRET